MSLNKKVFTLIEILIVVMLTGLLTSLAIAPVAVTVRRVVEVQNNYSDVSALSRTLNFIERDMSGALRLVQNALIVLDHEALGSKADDVLIFMSNSPAVQNFPASSIVYKLASGGIMHNDIIAGLYRWICVGRVPQEIDPEKLNIENAQLILPGVDSFSVELPGAGGFQSDRRKDYRGKLPTGIYIKITRGEDEELERVIVFP